MVMVRLFNSFRRPLKVYWWYWPDKYGKDMHNFGDEITADIVRKIFGFKSEWASMRECELIGSGSIINIAQFDAMGNNIKVWGSGFTAPGNNDNLKNLDFYAVRGKKTMRRISKTVPLGDPGILANRVYKPAREKHNKIGFLVNYVDADLPIVKKAKKDSRFVIIDPLKPPAQVAREISSCRLVLSSGLHGLIFADSFSVPNIHIKISDRLLGGEYKFRDYCSGVNKKYKQADISKIFDDVYLEDVIRKYEPIKDLRSIQKGLIRAFPIKPFTRRKKQL